MISDNLRAAWLAGLDRLLEQDPATLAEMTGMSEEDATHSMKLMREWRAKGLDFEQIIAGLTARLVSAMAGHNSAVH